MARDAFHSGKGENGAPGIRLIRRGAAALFQAGVDIAVVARIDGDDEIFLGIGEKFETGGGGVEAQQAQGGGALVARGEVKRQTLHRDAALAGAQVGEPDEPEGQQRRGVALGRTGDGGPAMLSMAQKGAREGGRETELQVGLGAELGQVPFGELAAQEQPETFAKHQPAAAAAEVGARAAAEIEQIKLPFAPREAFHGELHAGGVDSLMPVTRRARLRRSHACSVSRSPRRSRASYRRKGEQFLAGFEQRGLAGLLEEGLDFRAGLCSAAAGCPWDGEHGNGIVARGARRGAVQALGRGLGLAGARGRPASLSRQDQRHVSCLRPGK